MMYSSCAICLLFSVVSIINCNNIIDDSIIVNEINTYRNELICSKAALNMDYISNDTKLGNYAKYLVQNKRVLHGSASRVFVVSNTCNYKFNYSLPFAKNIVNFTRQCIRQSRKGYLNLSWLWNPKYTKIGCAYSTNSEPFIGCVLDKPTISTIYDYRVDVSTKYIDKLKSEYSTIIAEMCFDKLRSEFKSCYLTNDTRTNIIDEINSLRNDLAEQNCHRPPPQIVWNFNLEIIAIEMSKSTLDSFKAKCFASVELLNEIAGYEFKTNELFRVQPNLDKIIPKLIKNATENDSNNVAWLYGVHLNATGCTFFTDNGAGKFVCVFNRPKECINSTSLLVCDSLIIKTNPNCTNIQWRFEINVYVVCCIVIITFLIIIITIGVVKLLRIRQPIEIILRPKSMEPIYSVVNKRI